MRLSLFLGAAAVVTLFAAPASAQFTGVIVPPPAKPAQVAETPAPTIAAGRDSAARVTMTNMKDWVDSAAATLGVAPAPAATAADSAPAPAAPQVAQAPQAPAHPAGHAETTEFREGAKAPNTATPLPTLVLIGMTSLLAGLWLLRRRRA